MKKLHGKSRYSSIISLLLLFIIILSSSVRADTLQDQLNQYRQKDKQINTQLQVQKQEKTDALNKALDLQNSVNTLKNSTEKYQKNIGDLEQNLKSLDSKKQILNEERQKNIESLNSYLRNEYETGSISYLEVIFQAKSFSDLINKIEYVNSILNNSKELQNKLTSLNNDLNNQQLLINKKKDELENNLNEAQQSQQSLQLVLDKQKQIAGQLTSQEKLTLQKSIDNKREINRIQQLIEQEAIDARSAEQDKLKHNSPSLVFAPVSRGTIPKDKVPGGVQAILNYAAQFVGTPYVWGGTSPNGFDCSGFTQYVFKHFGINIARVSQDQYQNGTSVSKDNLLPGDLVFFQTYARGATHVGIYTGNGTMINSAGGGVGYDNINNEYWGPRYLGARRIVSQ